MKTKLMSFLLGALALSTFSYAEAGTVVRFSDYVAIEADQVVDNDFYAGASNILISGEIKGDFYGAGGNVKVNGPVGADLTVAGGAVSIDKPVFDDVRVVAGQVTITSEVGGDLFVLAGMLDVMSTANIKGNVYFYGGEANISGPVSGAVMGHSEKVRIDSSVGGVDVFTVETLTLGDRAEVNGDVRYTSNQEIQRSVDSKVSGEVVKNQLSETKDGEAVDWVGVTSFVVVIMFAALSIYLIAKQRLTELTEDLNQSILWHLVLGLGVFLVTPVIFLTLFITQVGLLLGMMIGLLYLLLLLTALIIGPIVLGAIVYYAIFKDNRVDLIVIILGGILSFVALAFAEWTFLILGLLLMLNIGAISGLIYKNIFNKKLFS